MNVRYYIMIMSALLSAACSEIIDTPNDEAKTVSLSASIASIDTTRAVDTAFTGTSTKDMEASVWFSTKCGVFLNETNPSAPTFMPYHATVKYLDIPTTVYVDPSKLENPLAYPVATINQTQPKAYCVGFYPNDTAWGNTADGKTAFHKIDGKTDIMFADQIEGSWDTPFEAQKYRHLLMWLKFQAHITDVEAASQWGNVTEISVENTLNEVRITFDNEKNQDGAYESTIEYVNNTSYTDIGNIYAVNDPSNGISLSVIAQDAGELLCAPSHQVTLAVKTKVSETKSYEKEITVNLCDENGELLTGQNYLTKAAGKLFIINLYFTPFDDIDAACSLIPWNEQNVDLTGN